MCFVVNLFTTFSLPGMGWHFIRSQESYITPVGAGCYEKIHYWHDTTKSVDRGGDPSCFWHSLVCKSNFCSCFSYVTGFVVIFLQASNTPLPTPTLLTRYVKFILLTTVGYLWSRIQWQIQITRGKDKVNNDVSLFEWGREESKDGCGGEMRKGVKYWALWTFVLFVLPAINLVYSYYFFPVHPFLLPSLIIFNVKRHGQFVDLALYKYFYYLFL